MITLKDIAEGISIEIKNKFGAITTVMPGMHYDLCRGKSPSIQGQYTVTSIGTITHEYLNSYAILHDIFKITITQDFIILSPGQRVYAPVNGLPDGMENIFVSAIASTARVQYLMSDPSSINQLMEDIAKLFKLNEKSKNAD